MIPDWLLGMERRECFQYELADLTVAPLVSVITPFFDTGSVFEQTRASLLGQSFQQWEWIIVNDASSDPFSMAILAETRDMDPRIKVLDQPVHRGPSAARNLAARLTRAPYLFFLDSDDLIEPTALEKLLWCLESHPEWTMCKGYTHGFGAQSYVSMAGFECPWLFLDRNPITLTALVRRDAFIAIGGFDEEMRTGLEDWDLWLRFAAHEYWGHTIPEVLDWYRRRPSHADRWGLWTERGASQTRRMLRHRYPLLFRQGPVYIPEHPFDESGMPSCENVPSFNSLKPRERVLLVVPSVDVLSVFKPELVPSDHPVTVVALGPSEQTPESLIAFSTPETFILAHFLHPDTYLRFLLYLVQSRKFDRALLWDCSLTLKLVPLLMEYNPGMTFERCDANGIHLLNLAEMTDFLESRDLAEALAMQAVQACARQRQDDPHTRRLTCHPEWLQQLGTFGVRLFLLKERTAYWGRWLRECFRLT